MFGSGHAVRLTAQVNFILSDVCRRLWKWVLFGTFPRVATSFGPLPVGVFQVAPLVELPAVVVGL